MKYYALAATLLLSSCSSQLSTYNALDGEQYTGDFKTYNSGAPANNRNTESSVILLSKQSDFDGEVTAKELAHLIKDVEEFSVSQLKKSKLNAYKANIRIYPNQTPTFNIGVMGKPEPQEIQRLHDKLSKRYSLKSKTRVLKLELIVKFK